MCLFFSCLFTRVDLLNAYQTNYLSDIDDRRAKEEEEDEKNIRTHSIQYKMRE